MGATPDQLKADIERTRAELAADVNSLADRVNPASAAKRRVGAVRAGAVGVKERVMGTAGDAVAGAPAKARTQAQGSPIAAGLIAFGTGLLAAALLPTTSKEQEIAGQVKDRAGELAQPVVEAAKDSAQQIAGELKPAAQDAVQSVKDSAGDAAAQTAETAKSAAGQVADTAKAAAGGVGYATTRAMPTL